MTTTRRALSLALFAVLGLALSGCPKKSSEVTPEDESAAAAPEEAAPEEAAAPQQPGIEIGTEYATIPALPAVTFGYMKADLSPEARAQLKSNAQILKAVMKAAQGVQIRVEGHCDDRGTLEYNLALGQRRANALRDYYASFGIPKSAVKTVSYGEERVLCAEATEDCWARCRRGETTLKASQPVRIPETALGAAGGQ